MRTNHIFTSLLSKILCWFGLLFSIGLPVHAQLCTGSLGDPVLNETFGKGSAASSLDAATTSYRYTPADCPDDGWYTLRSTTNNCFNSWHTLTDHTGDGLGNFMLVNASFEPSDFYLDTVKGLCANTVYEFSAWLMNVGQRFNQIKPNITFSIEKTDGTILSSTSSGDIPFTTLPQWNNYGFFFQIPPATFDVVLRMRNNAPGGVGNDIALDDITFRPCGPKILARIINNNPVVHLCAGDTTIFSFSSEIAAGFTNPSYQWQVSTNSGTSWKDIAGATQLLYTRKPTLPGVYLYRLTTVNGENGTTVSCRIASSVLEINIHAYPIVDAGRDIVLLKGDRTTLEGKVIGDSTMFAWSPQRFLENERSLRPTINPDKNITYILTATSVWGCSDFDSMSVKVVNQIYIPNAFTPNGDGLNDRWAIPDIDPSKGAAVKVFNRYGTVVYEARSAVVDWDGTAWGKPQGSGTFVYLVDLNNGRPPLRGLITLIR
jgi:gliding motility-associated-like protein